MILITFSSPPTLAAESRRQGVGGGFDAFTELIGPAGWIAGGRTLGVDDAANLRMGPSAIRSADQTSLSMTYAQPYRDIGGIDLGSIDLVTSRLSLVNVGFSYGQVAIGGLREASGGLTGRTFDARMDAVRVSVAPRRAGKRFGFGGMLNFYDVTIRDVSRTRFGLDLGSDLTFDSARLLLNVRNISGDRTNPDRLPIRGEMRGEWSPYKEMRLGGTISYEENGYADYQLGVAYDAFDLLTVLAGYENAGRQWSAGVIAHKGSIQVQYGIAAHAELEMTHTVTLGVSF